jgi:8-oxo-dGTP pyrophosphatase MutT (NUDIX family)
MNLNNMAAPKDPEKRKYMFSEDIKFLQKVVVYHPKENKILALRRSSDAHARPNLWDLPGGNVLFGDSHLDSLLSELDEETSLKVKDVRPIQVVTNYGNDIYYLFIGYSCKSTFSDVMISGEHSEYRWVTAEEFLKFESADFLVNLVRIL